MPGRVDALVIESGLLTTIIATKATAKNINVRVKWALQPDLVVKNRAGAAEMLEEYNPLWNVETFLNVIQAGRDILRLGSAETDSFTLLLLRAEPMDNRVGNAKRGSPAPSE